MWPHLRPRVAPDDRFVIAAHHPDRLRRPATSPATTVDDRMQQALIWNVFRTLELLTPSFWLRRFHIRLTGEPSVVPPQIVGVHLWQHLPLPPIQRIDGERPDIVADVVIETEHAVWTLIAQPGVTDGDRTAAIADAGAWFAGMRHHYCGVLEACDPNTPMGPILRERYSRSRESARLRSATRGPATPAHVHWGAIRWSQLAALLQDCSEAVSLPPVERALARNSLEWLIRVGVDPETADVSAQPVSQ
jgi:hypothetical protein